MILLFSITLIAALIFALLGVVSRDESFFILAAICFIAFLFSGLGGSLSREEIEKNAIKTGNAYYKQIVDKDGNVKNEFHWAKEPEVKTDCKCAECQKKIN